MHRFFQRLFRPENFPDQFFAATVVGVRFSRKHNLKFSSIFGDFAQPVQIRQNQISPFVPGGAACKSDGKDIWIELQSGLFVHLVEKFVLRQQMRGPPLFLWQSQRAAQTVIVLTPGRNVAVQSCLERWSGPRRRMHTVSNCFYWNLRKHPARYFSVQFGHAVHVVAHVQRQVRHVHRSAALRGFLQIREIGLRLQHAPQ